jgi:hypothetical protein
MRLPERDRHMLRWASLLHDIGKLSVPGELLRKSSAPDELEWEALRRHPAEGDRLLGPVREWLGPWAPAVEHHHEHFDGNGYPRGLRGEEISLGGRIVALADAFEAMTARRPYSRPVSPQAARQELVRRAGTQFDPDVCRAFLNISVGRLWRAVGLAAGVAQVPLAASIAGASGRVGPRVSSTGGVAAAGTLAAVVGLLPLATAPFALPSPRSSVAGARTDAPAVVPAPYPPVVTGTPVQTVPSPVPAPAPAAVVAVVVPPRPAVHAPAASSPATPAPHAVGVVLTVRPGSVHRQSSYVVTGTMSAACSGCTVTVSWGDGSAPQVLAVSGRSFSTSHVYAVHGRYVITVRVTSGSTLLGSASRRVVVNNG